METKELVCVNCPMGCRITVEMNGSEIISIHGNSCPRGAEYAKQESIRPMRILTTTVRIIGANHNVLPVITSQAIPLDMVFDCMDAIRKVSVHAPVKEGDAIVHNLLDTGADLIASRSMLEI